MLFCVIIVVYNAQVMNENNETVTMNEHENLKWKVWNDG